ncbi:hypothetical protein ACFQ07_04275 [Actinomadura adrarensis]|uniref:Cold shock domain-containing protein n=1 Tax=Actinomadura adrarensis TaxID=1819600 RepID=A0ABW3CCR4_9ACTN
MPLQDAADPFTCRCPIGEGAGARSERERMAAREHGVIVSWSDRKGRGQIRRTDGTLITFTSAALRQAPGSYLGMTVGLRVTFVLVDTGAGLRAEDVA